MIGKNETVYIAGPMTGLPLFNYPAFYGMAGMLEKYYGCKVLNPARQPDGLEYDEYIRRGLLDIKDSEVMVLLSGWANSIGARTEFQFATYRSCRIIHQHQIEADIKSRMDISPAAPSDFVSWTASRCDRLIKLYLR